MGSTTQVCATHPLWVWPSQARSNLFPGQIESMGHRLSIPLFLVLSVGFSVNIPVWLVRDVSIHTYQSHSLSGGRARDHLYTNFSCSQPADGFEPMNNLPWNKRDEDLPFPCSSAAACCVQALTFDKQELFHSNLILSETKGVELWFSFLSSWAESMHMGSYQGTANIWYLLTPFYSALYFCIPTS